MSHFVARTVALVAVLAVAPPAVASLELGVSVIPAGAGVSSGGSFSELATIGQPSAGLLSDDSFSMIVGFHGLDTFAPVVICKDITVELVDGEATIQPSDLDDGSYDNSGFLMLSVDRDTFTDEDAGEVEVILTATDLRGFSTSCVATVTVGAAPSWWLFY